MPSEIRGEDSFDSGARGVGVRQTWRARDTHVSGQVYTNDTPDPISIFQRASFPASGTNTVTARVDDVIVCYVRFVATFCYHHVSFVVPSGSSYTITSSGATMDTSAELRGD